MGYLALRLQSVWAYFTLKSQSKQIKSHVNKTNQKPYLIYVYIIYMFIPLMQQILKENSFLPYGPMAVAQFREGSPTDRDKSGKRDKGRQI